MKGKLISLMLISSILLVSREANAGAKCGDGICLRGENTLNCKEDCNVEYLSGNPFGLHAAAGEMNSVNELKADIRGIVRFRDLNPKRMLSFEEYVAGCNQQIVITLVSAKERQGKAGHSYYLLTPEELEEWKALVSRLVERYDGDDDFGCKLKAPDCYEEGDNLYPSEKFVKKIRKNPVKYWQVENEWLWQIILPGSEDKPSNQQLLNHFLEIRSAIKKSDPSAKIILGAFAGLIIPAGLDGYSESGFMEAGEEDLKYNRASFNNLPLQQRKLAEDLKKRIVFLIKVASPYYDVLDYHSYKGSVQDIEYETSWLINKMKELGVSGKEIWSMEFSGPFFNYDSTTHADELVKRYVVGLNSGIKKIFYSSLSPTLGWSENYIRLALIDAEGNKKPAYYTYKLMKEKLSGAISVEKIGDFIYKFSFPNNDPVFILWSETGERIADISYYVSSAHVKITHIVKDQGKKGRDAEIETVSSHAVKIDETPVFAQEER
ncbi:MAG: hypothetical protein AB1481_02705 [Candidatus Omnitrophota bacterium]